MILCENSKLCIFSVVPKTVYLALEYTGHLIFRRSPTDICTTYITTTYNQMLQINKVSMLVVCDYMCCCWLIYKSTVRGFILVSFAFSIHSILISLPRNRNGAKASRKLHLNIYEPICLCIRDGLPFVNDITARDPSKRPNPLYFQHYISKE